MSNIEKAKSQISEVSNEITRIFKKDYSDTDKRSLFTNYVNDLPDNEIKQVAQSFDILNDSVDKFANDSLVKAYQNTLNVTHGFSGVKGVLDAFNASGSDNTTIAKAVGQSNQKLGAYLTKVADQGSEAKASITGYGLSLVKMTAKTAVAKAATMTLNTVLMAGVAFLASTGIKKINDWIHAEENAKKKTAELAEKAVENINEYTQEKQALDDLFSKYTDIVTSVDKTIDKKSELTEIQKELTESLGLEANALDLVSQKYSDVLEKKLEHDKQAAEKVVKDNELIFNTAESINDFNYDEWQKEYEKAINNRMVYDERGNSSSSQEAINTLQETYRKNSSVAVASGIGTWSENDLKNAKEIAETLSSIHLDIEDDNRIRISGNLEEQLSFWKQFNTLYRNTEDYDAERSQNVQNKIDRLNELTEVYNKVTEAKKILGVAGLSDTQKGKLNEVESLFKKLENSNSSKEATEISHRIDEIKKSLYSGTDEGSELEKGLDLFFESLENNLEKTNTLLSEAGNQYSKTLEDFKSEQFEEVSQGIEKFNSALSKLSENQALSGDEMLALVELNGDLAGAFTKTADGFIIDSDKLLSAREAYTKKILELIKTEIEANIAYASSQESVLRTQKEKLEQLLGERTKVAKKMGLSRSQSDSEALYKVFQEYSKDIQEIESSMNTTESEIFTANENTKTWSTYLEVVNALSSGIDDNSKNISDEAKTADEYYEDQVYQIDKTIRKIQLEIDKQEKVLKTLEKQKEELEKIISNYETAASTAQSFIDMQKESVEKERELVSDSFDKRIEQLENQKKALESQNDNISKQINLQEKLNNLNKAKSQMVATYREDGGWTIGQNASAVNKAQNEYDEAVRQNNIDNIQGQIDTLTTEKDNKLSQYDKDIEKWDEYKQKWSDAVGSYKLKQNELIASQMLGSNWKASILARDTGIINNFESNYNGYQTRLHDDVEKEIEAVNNSIQSKQNEISSWELTKTHLNEWVEAIKKGDNQRLSDLSYFISEEQRLKNDHLKFLETFNSEYKRLSDLSEINGQEPTYYAVKDSNGNTVDKFTNRTDAELLKNQLHQADLTKAIKGKQYTTEELRKIVDSMKNDYTVQSYSTGGVIDYTGMANVHGSSSSPEVIFNSADAKKLFNVIHNSDNFLSSFTQSLSDRLYRDTIDQFHNVVNQNNNSTHYSPTFIIQKVVANDPIDFTRQMDRYINQSNLERMIGH